jgi:hypothetical protein
MKQGYPILTDFLRIGILPGLGFSFSQVPLRRSGFRNKLRPEIPERLKHHVCELVTKTQKKRFETVVGFDKVGAFFTN